ncbi:MAG: AAA family ATPase [Chloroflexota bacterium]
MSRGPIQLIIFSGLPGVGKSHLAEEIGSRLLIPVFAKDWLEATLKRSQMGVEAEERMGYASYELLTTLAERQLMLGQSAILDSVASIEKVRHEWRMLTQTYDAQWRVIECVCSDDVIHRQRLAGRQRNIPGWHELEWGEVERVRGYFVPWTEERLVVDTLNPHGDNVQVVLNYLG